MDHMESAMAHVMQLEPDQLRSLIAHAVSLHADKRGNEPTLKALRNVMGALDHDITLKRMEQIAWEVAYSRGLTLEELLAKSRCQHLAHTRHEAMYLMRAVRWPDGSHRYSLPQIGRFFRMDHSSVVHGVRRYARKLQREQLARESSETQA